MAGEIENLVLEHLRAIRGDIAEVKEGVRNLQVRVTSLEENTAAMNRRLDHMDRRSDRRKLRRHRHSVRHSVRSRMTFPVIADIS